MKKYSGLAVLLVLLLAPNGFAQSKAKIITIAGDIIHPLTADYIERGLKEAENDNALLIIKLDTPGGLLASTEKIVKLLLNSSVPVITYIYPKGGRAASAGVFIGYASHILAMSPSTHIGAAHPVIGGGKWGDLGEETKKKVLNDTLAWAETIARQRDRSVSFIKEAVEDSISITEEQALKKRKEKDDKNKRVNKRIIDLVAEDLDDLLSKIDGTIVTTSKGEIKISTQNITVEELPFSMREKFLNYLIHPNIAYLLFTLGTLGLIFEVTHPGFGFPGIAGMISLILAFYALSILPVNYAGLVLIVLGILFFVVEAFTPSFGLFTLGGLGAFILGSVMLYQQPEFIKVSLKFILPLAATMGAFSFFILAKVVRAHFKKPASGKEGLVAETGIAHTDITQGEGKVFIHGELWNAKSDQDIGKGVEVEVVEIKGLTLTVRKKEVSDA